MPYYNAKINDIEVGVYAEVHGKYYPASSFEPAEYPEIEIMEIWIGEEALPDAFYQVWHEDIDAIAAQIACGDLKPIGAED